MLIAGLAAVAVGLWGPALNGQAASQAVRDGILVATDYVYDDAGPDGGGEYPDDPRYARNGADIVELRARPTGGGLEVGVRLNALLDPAVPVVAVGIAPGDAPDEALPWAGVDLAARGVRWVVTVADGGATVTDLVGGDVRTLPARVDADENTVTVTAPVDVPDTGTWRLVAVAGIEDGERWTPFDVLAAAPEEPRGWQHARQDGELAAGDVTGELVDLDLAGSDREPPVVPGRVTRIHRSSVDVGEGIGTWTVPALAVGGPALPLGDHHLGLYQPYEVHVPRGYDPDRAWPLVAHLHGFGGNHLTLGDWARGTIDVAALAVSPLGRGPFTFFAGPAEVDVLEVLDDVARTYAVDPDAVHLSGTSMGGQATYRLAARYPDRFAAAVPLIGTSQSSEGLVPPPLDPAVPRPFAGGFPSGGFEALENLRNVPLRIYNGQLDWLVNNGFVQRDLVRLVELGIDHTYSGFTRRHHETVPAYTDVLYEEVLALRRDPNPARVVYRSHPWAEDPELGITYRGAYWVSDMVVRASERRDGWGRVDATSHALAQEARGAPVLAPPELRTFAPTGDLYDFRVLRVPVEPAAAAPVLEATLAHLDAVAFDVGRAGLRPARGFVVVLAGDGGTDVTLAGRFPRRVTVTRDGEPFTDVTVGRDGLVLHVDLDGAPSRFAIRPGA